MTLDVYRTSAFKRDLRRVQRQGRDMEELFTVIEKLVECHTLEEKYRDHMLFGIWKDHRECHIRPDRLLIYSITAFSLHLERTGSHSELFD